MVLQNHGLKVQRADIHCPRTNRARWKVARSDALDQEVQVVGPVAEGHCTRHGREDRPLAVYTRDRVADAVRVEPHNQAPVAYTPEQFASVGPKVVDHREIAAVKTATAWAMATSHRLRPAALPVAEVEDGVLAPSLVR